MKEILKTDRPQVKEQPIEAPVNNPPMEVSKGGGDKQMITIIIVVIVIIVLIVLGVYFYKKHKHENPS